MRCDATQAKAKHSLYNKTYYAKKKMRAAGPITTCKPAVTITPTTMSATASAAITLVGALGTTDKAAMGYYLVEWLSEPYSLQMDTDGMAGVIGAGKMVVDAMYFNRVQRAPFWYTKSEEATIVKALFVLKSGLDLEEVCAMNPMPRGCNKVEAMRLKSVKVNILDHEDIMEEAARRDWLEYDDSDEEEESASESEGESEGYV